FKQLDDAFEQAARAAAIDAAMIETKGDLCLGFGNKFLLCFIPRGNFLSCAETEQKRLIRQWNRRSPFHSEGSEIRNGRNAAGLHVGRNTPLPGKIDKLLVFRREIDKLGF